LKTLNAFRQNALAAEFRSLARQAFLKQSLTGGKKKKPPRVRVENFFALSIAAAGLSIFFS